MSVTWTVQDKLWLIFVLKKKVIAKNIFSLNAIEMVKNNCANKYN